MAKQGNDRGPLVGLYRDDAERMGAVVKLVEGESKGGPSRRGYRRTYLPGNAVPALTKSGSAMTAASISGSTITPTTFTASLLIPGTTGNQLVAGPDAACLNFSSRAIATANKLIYLVPFNGKYHFLVGDC